MHEKTTIDLANLSSLQQFNKQQERQSWGGIAQSQTSRNAAINMSNKEELTGGNPVDEGGYLTSKRKIESSQQHQYSSLEQFAAASSPRSNQSRLMKLQDSVRQDLLTWNQGGRMSQATTVITYNTAERQQDQSYKKILEGRESLFQTGKTSVPVDSVQRNKQEDGIVVNPANLKQMRNKKVPLSCARPIEEPGANEDGNLPRKEKSDAHLHLNNNHEDQVGDHLSHFVKLTPSLNQERLSSGALPSQLAKTNSMTSVSSLSTSKRRTTFLEKVQNKQKVSAMTREIQDLDKINKQVKRRTHDKEDQKNRTNQVERQHDRKDHQNRKLQSKKNKDLSINSKDKIKPNITIQKKVDDDVSTQQRSANQSLSKVSNCTGLPTTGAMQREREIKQQKHQRHKDMMHLLSEGFNKLITKKIDEEAYETRYRALKYKDDLQRRDSYIKEQESKNSSRRKYKSAESSMQEQTEDDSDNLNRSKENAKATQQFLQQTQLIKHSQTLSKPKMIKMLTICNDANINQNMSKINDKGDVVLSAEQKDKIHPISASQNTQKHKQVTSIVKSPRKILKRAASSQEGLIRCQLQVYSQTTKNNNSNHQHNNLRNSIQGSTNITFKQAAKTATAAQTCVDSQGGFPLQSQRDTSSRSVTKSVLVQKYQEEENKRETLSWLKQNMQFRQKIMALRNQVQEWTFELCKEENKRNYDRMAQLVSDYEEKEEGQGIMSWVFERVKSISPTIMGAVKRLNGLLEASQFSDKRMMNYILQKNNFSKKDFLDENNNDAIMLDEEDRNQEAIHNINYMLQKIQGVKELIIEKMLDSIQQMFEVFVRQHTHDQNPLFENKLIFYCLLKTEGDIMIELNDYNKAIQAYKALRNYCKVWGLIEQEMWMVEQIGMTYRQLRYHELAVDYFKCQLSLAWERGDEQGELRSYDNLSTEYYYVGNIDKATLYHERVMRGRIEGQTTAKNASSLLNNYNRKFREVKYKFDQNGLKGTKAKDVGKRANFGEGQGKAKYVTRDDTQDAEEEKERADHYYKRLEFENALQKDAEIAYATENALQLKNTAGMTPQERFLEYHKRAARRNFLLGSNDQKAKIRERYKPANLKGIVKVKGTLPEKSLPFDEQEFRVKVRESVNRLEMNERNKSDKIFYTQLSKGRRDERVKEKAKIMMNNCRQYLEFMENYILEAIKEDNQAIKDAQINNKKAQQDESIKIVEDVQEDNAESFLSQSREESFRKASQ